MGRYEVLRVIGKGAMGVVYEGRDPNLDRRVAIKTVKVENLSEEAAAEYEHRFRTEARSAARLQHPNIVSVYDSDRDGNVAFLVMEYIQGDDLKHHLDRGQRYSLEQSLKIVRDLLSALDYAHKAGIVHRDIKPANLLIEPAGRVKLTDFGVARIQDSGEATRTQGSMIGTLKYMAPEQVQGQKIDSRADLFSAGVVLYQLLTDKRPFDGDNDFSIIHQIIGHTPPPPSSINPRLPGALDAVVARALAKDREERFATARDFAVALQAAIRRAEDQTVVPPLNPNRRPEPALSRPLTTPGTVPPGGTVPGGVTTPGGTSTVTQELELVYWKDVKDATDPEELQGFLEKFPAGIYADLARRRLRKLSGGDQTVAAGMTQPGSGMAAATPAFTASVFPNSAFPNLEAGALPPEAARPGADASSAFQPTQWIEEEYTRTVAEPPADAAAATATTVPEGAAAAAASAAAAPAPTAKPRRAPEPAAPAKRKVPVAVLAGVGVLAVAGVLAMVMGRGKGPAPEPQAQAPSESVAAAPQPAPAAAPTAPAAPVVAAAPADAPAAASASATKAVPAPAGAAHPLTKAERDKERAEKAAARKAAAESQPKPGTRTAAVPPAPEPARSGPTPPPRIDPEPARALPPPVTTANSGNGANYQAVDQCKDRMFLAKELCLAEHCDKAGARNHPLCVKRREEARMREESKVPR
ncbi:serine/threonine-protein kinase [Ramlibacter sp. AN1133]|uniref:serine/threonine-protein kinase n=1 Tax=Ramlibacter sp. AN1133 TaxID=3133429 RepID=UPI0030C5002C